MSLSATLPSNKLFLLVASKMQLKAQDEPLILLNNINALSTPTSESSSQSIPLNYKSNEDTLSQTDEVHSGNTIFSKKGIDSAHSFSKEKGAFTFNIEPLSAAPTALFKPSHFNPLGEGSKQLKVRNKFDDDFYNRIEDFLDKEGLEIAIPEDKFAQKSKASVRRLLTIRALSEDAGNGMVFFSENNSDDEPLSLRQNITASSLIQRRASLNNTSSSELEISKQNLPKGKLYFSKLLRETEEIHEENENSEWSKRSSPYMPSRKAPGRLNTHFIENGLGDSFELLSDLQSSLSRKNSQKTPHYFSKELPQSLSKLSPITKGTRLNVEPTTYFSPQLALKKTTKALPKVSPLSIYVRKPQARENKDILRKTMQGISSFGDILSNSSESSPEIFNVDFN